MSIGVESDALWISSPNTIKFYNNGTNMINTSGNVGIGTNSTEKLDIS